MQEGMFLQKSAVAKGTVLKEGSAPELEPGPLEVRATPQWAATSLSVRVMIILQIDAKAGTGRTRTGLALHFTSD